MQLLNAALALGHQIKLLLGQLDDRLHLFQDRLGLVGGRIGALCVHIYV